MRYLIVLLLVGCATEPANVRLVTPEELECASKATQFMTEHYPDAKLDARGIPSPNEMVHYAPWAMVADRCMKARGAY